MFAHPTTTKTNMLDQATQRTTKQQTAQVPPSGLLATVRNSLTHTPSEPTYLHPRSPKTIFHRPEVKLIPGLGSPSQTSKDHVCLIVFDSQVPSIAPAAAHRAKEGPSDVRGAGAPGARERSRLLSAPLMKPRDREHLLKQRCSTNVLQHLRCMM